MNSVNRRVPIHILLSLVLVFSLGFYQNQSFAFAEDLSDTTLEAAESSELPESGQADIGESEDTSGNTETTEEVGSIEDTEEPTVSPSEELEVETNIEEVVEENISLKSLSSPRVGASIIVYDLAAFVAALADTNYSTIYLGADIVMTSTTAQVANRALVIDGTDPDTGVVHSYTDYNSTAVGSVSLYGTCDDLTFRNIQVTVNNWYGIYRYTPSGTRTLTFDSVTGSSPQFYHYCSSVVGSTFIIKDSSLSLDHLGSVDGELAEADIIVFQGEVSIARTSSPGFALFNCIGGSTRSVTIEDGSHVMVDMSLSTTAPGGLFYYVQSFAVGNNASFTCYSGAGMTYSQATAVTVGDYSDLNFHYTGSSTRSNYYLYLTSLNVGNQSSFLMYDNSSAAYGALRCSNTTLNNPRSFVILNGYANASARAIGSSAVALSASNIKNIRYFSYSQIPSVYDSSSHSFIGDGSVYSMWWTQQPAFALSASAWQGTAPGVTSTPAYDESNIPSAAIGLAQSTLTSSNFGVSTNAAAGIEISGEIDATINIEYYFDDVHDDSYDRNITVDALSNVNVTDVELGSVPTGYVLATTPTDPVLPQTASSLDNTTVKVYYVTDPSQTATINLEYYFDNVYDASYDATITPQILTSVGITDVTLSSVPTGYVLSSTTPTAPGLPESAQALDNTTISVYYVTDSSQTATIDVEYYFDGAHDSALDTVITPQLLSNVNVTDVELGSVPTGYVLATTPTDPVLPQTASSLDNTTVKVYYVTDPSQTATINLEYYFDNVYDASYDATITPQILTSVGITDVTLSSVPTGYVLSSTTPTAPGLPESAQALDNTTISVYYVTDSSQTATIDVEYYFDGAHDSALDTVITPVLTHAVTLEEVILVSLPAEYVLSSPATVPELPQFARDINNTTIKVYYEHSEQKNDSFYSNFLLKTGDSVFYLPAIIVLLLSILFLAALLRKRRKKDVEPD